MSELTRPDLNLQKRKADTEKGEYAPEMPPYTKKVRTHIHKFKSGKQRQSQSKKPEKLQNFNIDNVIMKELKTS